ncbi:MAG: GTPase, partial [Acetobacteraceae bacterium]|nr:GTPase [Acetobacteraceae bacterium]
AAARAAGAAEIVDPRASATPEIAAVFAAWPQLGPVLPAMGYDAAQLRGLAQTIARSTAEVVVSGTPADIGRLLGPAQHVVRARYEFAEMDEPGLGAQVDAFLGRIGLV